MTLTYEEALARLVKERENLKYIPVLTSIEFDAGGEWQLSSVTWDSEDAKLKIGYRDPAGTPGKKRSTEINFIHYTDKYEQTAGFAALMADLIRISNEQNKEEN